MGSSIGLRQVSKVFPGGQLAVERVSLDVEPGEFLVILGPSGCGKSTLLRMIAGLEEISEGELEIDSEPASHLPPAHRDVAMVFQNFALYPSMRAADNVGFPLRISGRTEEEVNARVNDMARMLSLEDLLGRYPSQLSGGERQRVAMGRAVIRRPSIFLMDEPLSNLDAKLRHQLRSEILGVTRQTGATTVYVTHDQSEAMSLGDRVAVMRGGVLQQVDTPRAVYARPANVFVAAFVGVPRINLLHGTVIAPLGGAMAVDLGEQRLTLPQPLSRDHQLLRIQQNRPLLIGLRAESVRVAPPDQAAPYEAPLSGTVQHVDYQGHETLLHLTVGARAAEVPDLDRPGARRRARVARNTRPARGSSRLQVRRLAAAALRRADGGGSASGAPGAETATVSGPSATASATAMTLGDAAGELVVRAVPHAQPVRGDRLPLLVDLRSMLVFDQAGNRICPAPSQQPNLEL
ncbi:ABC transporter ATP-binding protein [Streptomyces odontomachi]|uniref:ABC transporter ATP-binding protein n=1 Tax=Streptomyces odontomachi TaxID=2944940 RepID=UPI00210A2B50|nr:ABC transporter ATP-binding protein [Streptomyces sp. ODS25]